MWVLFWVCRQIWMPAHLALLQTDNSFWVEVTVEYKSYFLDKIRVLFAPRQRFSKGWKRNVSLSPSVSLLKLVPSCYAATTVWEGQSKGLLEVLCSVWANMHVCVQMCKMFRVVSRQAHVVLTLSCCLLGTLTELLRGTAHPILQTPSLCRVNIVVFDSLCLSLLLWFCWTILNILGLLRFPFAYSTITHEDSYKNIYL